MKKLGWYLNTRTGDIVYAEAYADGDVLATPIENWFGDLYDEEEFKSMHIRLPWYKQLWYSFLEG